MLQGVPGPESERNAIDVVIQYAVEVLGFSVSNIVIYAWSIGEWSHHFFVLVVSRSTELSSHKYIAITLRLIYHVQMPLKTKQNTTFDDMANYLII